MLIIYNADPLVMHLYVIGYRQYIRLQIPVQRHAAADVFIFPDIRPHPGAAAPVCEKGWVDNFIQMLVRHNTVMNDYVAFMLFKYLQHTADFVWFPDIILIRQKNISPLRMRQRVGNILLDASAWARDQPDARL